MLTKARVMAKILVVDDEPDAVDLVEFNLKSAGYEVVTAADGAEALKKAKAHSPDLILLDLNLPRKNGREVLGEIKKHSRLQVIPVVVFTTSSADVDRVACAKAEPASVVPLYSWNLSLSNAPAESARTQIVPV